MPRLKAVIDPPLQESIIKEIKKEYGAYLSQAQLARYLCIGKNRTDIFRTIPAFHITPGKVCYRASDIAAWLAARRSAPERTAPTII